MNESNRVSTNDQVIQQEEIQNNQSINNLSNSPKNNKSKKILILVIILLLIFLLISTGFAIYFGSQISTNNDTSSTEITNPSPEPNSTIIPTVAATKTNSLRDLSDLQFEQLEQFNSKPEYKTLYAGLTTSNSYPLFYALSEKYSVYLSDYSETSYDSEVFFPFYFLQNPTVLYKSTIDFRVDSVSDSNNDFIYFSIFPFDNSLSTSVYVTDIKNQKRAKLFETRIEKDDISNSAIVNFRNEEIVTDYYGFLFPDFIFDNYLVLRISNCSSCAEIGPGKVLILNTQTGKQLWTDKEIGNIKFDLEKRLVLFNSLEVDENYCEKLSQAFGNDRPCFGNFINSEKIETLPLP